MHSPWSCLFLLNNLNNSKNNSLLAICLKTLLFLIISLSSRLFVPVKPSLTTPSGCTKHCSISSENPYPNLICWCIFIWMLITFWEISVNAAASKSWISNRITFANYRTWGCWSSIPTKWILLKTKVTTKQLLSSFHRSICWGCIRLRPDWLIQKSKQPKRDTVFWTYFNPVLHQIGVFNILNLPARFILASNFKRKFIIDDKICLPGGIYPMVLFGLVIKECLPDITYIRCVLSQIKNEVSIF